MTRKTTTAIAATLFIIATAAAALATDKVAPATPPRGIPPASNPDIAPAGAGPGILSPIEAMGYGDFKGVIHAHTYLSHDSYGTASRVVQAAQSAGVKFVLMTDHPSQYSSIHGLRGMRGGVLFLPGEELNRSDASLLAIDLEDKIETQDTQGSIDEIHKQGGLAIISHVEGFTGWDAKNWDAMEIYNTHYDALLDKKIEKTISLIPYLEKDPDRVWQSILDRPDVYLDAWDAQLKKRRVTGVAANDSHENVVFNGFQLDSYERSYSLVSTHLFLMELTQDEIKRAIKRGNGYVCFDFLAPCRGFSFTASDGKTIGIMGDDYRLNPEQPSRLEIHTPRPAKIQLLKDGAVIAESQSDALAYDLAQPGVYRVEVYSTRPKSKKLVQWIFSNPIYVR